jgi:hypothetical protein
MCACACVHVCMCMYVYFSKRAMGLVETLIHSGVSWADDMKFFVSFLPTSFSTFALHRGSRGFYSLSSSHCLLHDACTAQGGAWIAAFVDASRHPTRGDTLGDVYRRAEQKYWEKNKGIGQHNAAAPAVRCSPPPPLTCPLTCPLATRQTVHCFLKATHSLIMYIAPAVDDGTPP